MVDRYGRAELPPGVIDRGIVEDADAVAKVVVKLIDAVYKPKRPRSITAGIALPETQIFSKTFRLPANLDADLVLQAAEQEAKDVFPIDLRQAYKEAVTVHRDKDGQDVYFAAVLKKVLQGYVEVARRAGIEPAFFDSEAVSVARALIRSEDPPTLLLDIGGRSTTLSVVVEGGVRMTADVAIAGNQLTEALETKLKVPMQEAEKLKRTYGFDPAADDDRILFPLQGPMREIINEAKRIVAYYRRKTGRAIPRVLLTGGTSLTPSIADYLASNLPDLAVVPANPLEKVHIDDSAVSEHFHRTATMHTAAIGLALRAIGVMTHPHVTFVTEKRQGFSLSKLFTRIGERITSMSPRAKKAPSEKKSAKHEDPKAVPAAVPEPAATPAPATPPPAVVSERQDDDSVLAQLSPAIEAQKELEDDAAASAVPAVTEPELASIAPPTNDQLYAEQLTGEHRKTLAEPDEEDLYHASSSDGYAPPRKSRAGMLVLVVLVLILGISAVAGVTLFLKKNDMMDGVAALMPWNKDPKPSEEVPTGPVIPESVVATFRLRADGEATPAIDGSKAVLIGRVLETEVSASESFATTGTVPSVGGSSKGFVTIVNTTSTAYTFVATTRVLSEDGVLFRLDSQTPIPANGSVRAAVTADAPGASGDIGPARFTIPGLGASFTSTVYATSDAAMIGGAGGDVPAVSVDDLVTAKTELREAALTEATADLDVLRRPTEALDAALYMDTETAFTAPEAGTLGSSFDASLSLTVKALTVPEDEAMPLLDAALTSALPEGVSAADYTLGSVAYYVVAFDAETLEADVRMEAPVRAAR